MKIPIKITSLHKVIKKIQNSHKKNIISHKNTSKFQCKVPNQQMMPTPN